MPTYEYYCRKCDKTFNRHMTISDHNKKRIQCPHCKGRQIDQVMSSFTAVTSKKS